MKILVVGARDPQNRATAGGDRYMFQIASQLAAQAHDVTFLCGRGANQSSESQMDGVRIVRVAPSRFVAPVIWALAASRALPTADLIIEEMIGGERLPFLLEIFSPSPVIEVWYQDNTKLFQATYGPVIASIAGLVQSVLLVLGRRRGAICLSGQTRGWLVSCGFQDSKVFVYHPTVRPFSSEQDVPPSFLERENSFISIGNFRRLKRFEEALHVLKRLKSKAPQSRLTLLGRRDDDRYASALRELAEKLQVVDSVRFVFDAAEEDKHRLMRNAKVLTVHSPVEGFGWTVPEAGLLGVPVVGNDGLPDEVLRSGVNGVRVSFGDVNAYADAILLLFEDQARWEELSVGARRVAREFLDSKSTRVDLGKFGQLVSGGPTSEE